MVRRIVGAVVVIGSVVAAVAVWQGPATGHPLGQAPGGSITCSTHVTQAKYSHALSSAGTGPLSVSERGLFTGCTGNTGDPVIGGTYAYTLRSANGPRTCPAAITTATFGGPNQGKIQWWANMPANGQEETFTSASTKLVSISASGLFITVKFKLTSGAFAGSVITANGNVTRPGANFLALCNAGLMGDGLTGGNLSVGSS